MAKYKVGDKVRIVGYRTFHMNSFGEMDKWLGKVMTVRGIERGLHGYWMVEDCGENKGRGWLWVDSMIAGLAEPDREYTVELRFDGMITTATLKRGGRDVKTAEARCNPTDTYSRAEGARVAVERLFEKKRKEDKPKDSKPKMGDKFVVVGDLSGHEFPIGDIVTLCRVCNGWRLYMNQYGRKRWVYDFDVKPYKENTK
ncbi:hypothetical protein [Prevotella sp.]|uniref:hypothetical protein n=1 Tax=Prevotella sp. TaxID=59823 RepID=UPI0027E2D1EB|nr:hypothetical protein [Prevotella sp.]